VDEKGCFDSRDDSRLFSQTFVFQAWVVTPTTKVFLPFFLSSLLPPAYSCGERCANCHLPFFVTTHSFNVDIQKQQLAAKNAGLLLELAVQISTL